ncbi:unnamed protein product, partial [Mesorhabditis belari]|uniref:Uncharacterized protein n=1 Tax=Mesorhabditis belari TaxID=2138241 RepID=A0AAF3F1N5_9BILA
MAWNTQRNQPNNEFYSPFSAQYISDIFHGQHTLLIGDSLMRGLYKDLIRIIDTGRLQLTEPHVLKTKSEISCFNDRQIDMDKFKGERVFVQAREYHTENHLIQYHFTTRCFKEDLDCAIAQMVRDKKYPRMVFFNSCLWDLTRYHKLGLVNNQNKLDETTSHVFVVLFPQCIPAVGRFNEFEEGGYDGDTRNNKEVIRLLYVKANKLAAQIARLEGFSVIDLDYHLSVPIFDHLRISDGIHWDNRANRFMLQLIILHLVKDLELYVPRVIMERVETLFGKIDTSDDGFLKAFWDGAKKSKSVLHIPNADTPVGTTNRQVFDVVRMEIPYYECLQAELQETVCDSLSEDKKKKINDDITKMRMALFLQQGGILDERDHEEFTNWIRQGQSIVQDSSSSRQPPQQFIRFPRQPRFNGKK